MQVIENHLKTKPGPEKPALSRAQRRQIERIEEECQQVHQTLANNFLSFMVTHENPTDEVLAEKAKQIDSQWRVFARQRHLHVKMFDLLKKYCSDLIEEFKKSKSDEQGRDQSPA